ncbi:hypothetical protein LWI28_015509 [Acer negundo]|uniref:Uncharacterized protein n=1 Tax=Acer negundo TaxID=4023 RepID=A0AAD5JEF5_ACENE|nr:hypothetical protein LWI28_015509 [Acer negundo]
MFRKTFGSCNILGLLHALRHEDERHGMVVSKTRWDLPECSDADAWFVTETFELGTPVLSMQLNESPGDVLIQHGMMVETTFILTEQSMVV